jgi:hypothetical protein
MTFLANPQKDYGLNVLAYLTGVRKVDPALLTDFAGASELYIIEDDDWCFFGTTPEEVILEWRVTI